VVLAEPERLPPPSGAITVTANRSGALVRLDGEPAGFTPLALPAVPIGVHQIVVSQAGVRPLEESVSVHPDERAWITASLMPPPSTERSPLTWVVGGTGILALVAGAVLTGFAVDTHDRYSAALGADPDPDTVGQLRDLGGGLNIGADVMFSVAAAGLGGGILLFFVTESTRDQPSSSTIDRGPR